MMMQIGYWAKLLDDANAEPVAMLGSASPSSSACFAQRLIEQTEGAWIAGAVSVWGAKQAEEDATIFDISARFVVNADDEDEIDCEVEIVERFDEEM
jgi:hypothetical protein